MPFTLRKSWFKNALGECRQVFQFIAARSELSRMRKILQTALKSACLAVWAIP